MNIGDTVRLKGQPYSPIMTIVGFTAENSNIAMCQHFEREREQSKLVTNIFHVEALILFSENNIGLFMEYIDHLPAIPKNEHPTNVSKEVLVRLAQNIAHKLNLIDKDEKLIAVSENIKTK